MEDVLSRTIITSLVVGAIATVIIILMPFAVLPCRSKNILTGTEYENTQCFGYLNYKLEYQTPAAGVRIDYSLLLLYSIIFIVIITIAAFFITLFPLYMKAGRESKL